MSENKVTKKPGYFARMLQKTRRASKTNNAIRYTDKARELSTKVQNVENKYKTDPKYTTTIAKAELQRINQEINDLVDKFAAEIARNFNNNPNYTSNKLATSNGKNPVSTWNALRNGLITTRKTLNEANALKKRISGANARNNGANAGNNGANANANARNNGANAGNNGANANANANARNNGANASANARNNGANANANARNNGANANANRNSVRSVLSSRTMANGTLSNLVNEIMNLKNINQTKRMKVAQKIANAGNDNNSFKLNRKAANLVANALGAVNRNDARNTGSLNGVQA